MNHWIKVYAIVFPCLIPVSIPPHPTPSIYCSKQGKVDTVPSIFRCPQEQKSKGQIFSFHGSKSHSNVVTMSRGKATVILVKRGNTDKNWISLWNNPSPSREEGRSTSPFSLGVHPENLPRHSAWGLPSSQKAFLSLHTWIGLKNALILNGHRGNPLMMASELPGEI